MTTHQYADNDPYLIIAADSHAGLPTEEYRGYLASKYHDAFDDFLGERAAVLEEVTKMGIRDDDYAKKWFEEHDEELAGGWDAIKRDQATADHPDPSLDDAFVGLIGAWDRTHPA